MTTTNLLIIIGAIVVIAFFIIFPSARSLLKGLINVFIQDKSKTPEGARAIYDNKIQEVQQSYNKASTLYNKLVGEVMEAEKNLQKAERDIKVAEANAESAMKAGREEDARLFAEGREDALIEAEDLRNKLNELRPMRDEAKRTFQEYEKLLLKLRLESKKVVKQLESDEQMAALYKELDENCRVTVNDKLLDSVREGAADLRKEATGAAAVHADKYSTRKSAAEKRAASDRTTAYLEQLKSKYGK